MTVRVRGHCSVPSPLVRHTAARRGHLESFGEERQSPEFVHTLLERTAKNPQLRQSPGFPPALPHTQEDSPRRPLVLSPLAMGKRETLRCVQRFLRQHLDCISLLAA